MPELPSLTLDCGSLLPLSVASPLARGGLSLARSRLPQSMNHSISCDTTGAFSTKHDAWQYYARVAEIEANLASCA